MVMEQVQEGVQEVVLDNHMVMAMEQVLDIQQSMLLNRLAPHILARVRLVLVLGLVLVELVLGLVLVQLVLGLAMVQLVLVDCCKVMAMGAKAMELFVLHSCMVQFLSIFLRSISLRLAAQS